MNSSDYRFLVTGAGGLLGRYLVKVLEEAGIVFFAYDKASLDITEVDSLRSTIAPLNITHIINCAAYTNVAKAEIDRDLCYKVNVIGVQNLVEVSNHGNIELIQISTDYVFDGKCVDGLYYPDSIKNPLNYYGLTKSLAEDYILAKCKVWKIIRTSWLFGFSSNNFVNKIINSSYKKNIISINNLEVGVPTYGLDLAYAIIHHLHYASGIYHITNSGTATRYQYAKHILDLTTHGEILINNVLQYDVKRPRKVVLFKPYDLVMRHWTISLSDYLSTWSSLL